MGREKRGTSMCGRVSVRDEMGSMDHERPDVAIALLQDALTSKGRFSVHHSGGTAIKALPRRHDC